MNENELMDLEKRFAMKIIYKDEAKNIRFQIWDDLEEMIKPFQNPVRAAIRGTIEIDCICYMGHKDWWNDEVSSYHANIIIKHYSGLKIGFSFNLSYDKKAMAYMIINKTKKLVSHFFDKAIEKLENEPNN